MTYVPKNNNLVRHRSQKSTEKQHESNQKKVVVRPASRPSVAESFGGSCSLRIIYTRVYATTVVGLESKEKPNGYYSKLMSLKIGIVLAH